MPSQKRTRSQSNKPNKRQRKITRSKKYATKAYNQIMGRNHMNFPLGLQRKVEHRYAQFTVSLNPGTGGTAAGYTFSANGMYDPNISGTGHQPMGFDQMAALYDDYIVIHSQIRAFFHNNSQTNGCVVGIVVSDESSVGGDPETIVERGHTVYRAMGPSGGTQDVTELQAKVAPHKWFGINNPMDYGNLYGTTSANPTDQVYFIIWAAPLAGIDLAALDCTVVIDYVAIWTNPTNTNPS